MVINVRATHRGGSGKVLARRVGRGTRIARSLACAALRFIRSDMKWRSRARGQPTTLPTRLHESRSTIPRVLQTSVGPFDAGVFWDRDYSDQDDKGYNVFFFNAVFNPA